MILSTFISDIYQKIKRGNQEYQDLYFAIEHLFSTPIANRSVPALANR